MSIVSILIILVVIGVCIYLVNAYIPLPQPFKAIFNIVAVIATVIWLLSVFGFVRIVAVIATVIWLLSVFGFVRIHGNAGHHGCSLQEKAVKK